MSKHLDKLLCDLQSRRDNLKLRFKSLSKEADETKQEIIELEIDIAKISGMLSVNIEINRNGKKPRSKVIEFLETNKDRSFSVSEISDLTGIRVTTIYEMLSRHSCMVDKIKGSMSGHKKYYYRIKQENVSTN